MAKIPLYESNAALTRQAPSAKVSVDQAGTNGRILQAAGQEMAKLNQKYVELDTVNRTNEEERNLRNGLTKLQTDYTQDPDLHKNKDKYNQQLTDLRASVGKSIYEPKARAQFEAQADYYVNSERIQLTNQLVKHQQNIATADLLTNIRSFQENYAATGDPKWIKMGMDGIDKGLKVGFLSATNAIDIEASMKKDFGDYAIYRDSQIHPQIAFDKLKDGKYNDVLTKEERIKWETKLKKDIKTRDKVSQMTMESAQDRNELNYGVAAIDGELVGEELNKAIASEGVLPDVGEAIKQFSESEYGSFERLKNDPKAVISQKNNDAVVTELSERIENAVDNSDKPGILKAYKDIFIEGSKGNLNVDTMRAMIGNLSSELAHSSEEKRNDPVRKITKAYMQNAKTLLANVPNAKAALSNFYQAYYKIPKDASDEDRRKRVNEIMGQITRSAYPPLVGLDQIPHNIADAFGYVKRIWNGEVASGISPNAKEKSKPGKPGK